MATPTAARPNVRRMAALWVAAILAISALAAAPASAAAADFNPNGCTTATLSSTVALRIDVAAADCGDPADTGFFAVAELVQDSTGDVMKSWGWDPLGGRAGSWINESINVPAQGGYTLTITGNATGGEPTPAIYTVSAIGGNWVTVSKPVLQFRIARMSAGSVPATVVWSNTSNNAQFDFHYRVRKDSGSWSSWTRTYKTSFNLNVALGHTYTFEVYGRNVVLTPGPHQTAVFHPKGYSEASSKITYTGTWRYSRAPGYWGDRTKYAKSSDAKARFTFTGREAALVVPMGPSRGSFRVAVDGAYRLTVKSFSYSTVNRQVLYLVRWSEPGPHTVTIRVVGTAGHPRVDLDGVMTLD